MVSSPYSATDVACRAGVRESRHLGRRSLLAAARRHAHRTCYQERRRSTRHAGAPERQRQSVTVVAGRRRSLRRGRRPRRCREMPVRRDEAAEALPARCHGGSRPGRWRAARLHVSVLVPLKFVTEPRAFSSSRSRARSPDRTAHSTGAAWASCPTGQSSFESQSLPDGGNVGAVFPYDAIRASYATRHRLERGYRPRHHRGPGDGRPGLGTKLPRRRTVPDRRDARWSSRSDAHHVPSGGVLGREVVPGSDFAAARTLCREGAIPL